MRREMDHRFYGEEHDASQEALQRCGYFLCVRVVCFDDNNQAVIPDGFSRQGVHHGSSNSEVSSTPVSTSTTIDRGRTDRQTYETPYCNSSVLCVIPK